MWPPAFAADSDKAVGKWTVVRRRDGRMQWAYDGSVLYTSIRDRRPGDVLGGDSYRHQGDAPAVREPIQPRPDVPPGLAVSTTLRGRLLQTARGLSIYAFDRDTGTRSACDAACEQSLSGAGTGRARARRTGRSSRGKAASGSGRSAASRCTGTRGSGRASVAAATCRAGAMSTQEAPPPPAEFTIQDTPSGQVLADARGALYSHLRRRCAGPVELRVSADTRSIASRCAAAAAPNAARAIFRTLRQGRSRQSRLWSVVEIDPATGHFAARTSRAHCASGPIATPIYTFAGDAQPGKSTPTGWENSSRSAKDSAHSGGATISSTGD
jgi:predicted lipoprotein with Yx(FWY)xxD motif